jgi:plastocyanin
VSRPRRAIVASLAVAAVGAVALAPAGGASAKRATKPKIVKVSDDIYTPDDVTVRKYGKVKWDWTPVFNQHNVTLKKAPNGVRKADFRSQTTASPSYAFTRKFKKPGKYHFYCTIHPDVMQMDVVVKR